ncbi:hypothetical protein Q9L58_006553 [Maublancomyces gigas]|uniref:F-box domain-containing protein n=1 Tax=Discina gigas TaxID=1032678 RepID=A0ABR3GF27_9PEZI
MAVLSILSTLPTEMLIQIFSSLDRVELLKICLVSRRLHSIASPFLYSQVTVSASTIQQFIRTILAREELAKYVKSLRSTWPLEGSHQWNAVQVSLLLHLLPNLHVIDCTPPVMQPGEFPELLNIFCEGQTFDTLPVGLQSLQEIRNGPNELEDPYEHNCVSYPLLFAMLKLPSIRKIHVNIPALAPPPDFSTLCTSHNRSSSLTDLEMVARDQSSSTLLSILQVPKALTRLSYSHSVYELPTVDFSAVGIAINQHRASLQELVFDFWHMQDDDHVQVCQSIGSLRNWPLLTKVKSPLLLLLGMPNTAETQQLGDVLPVVIRELTIDWDLVWEQADMADAIVYLVERKEMYGLVRLEVINATRWLLRHPYHRSKVIKACTAAGIRFQTVDYDWLSGNTFTIPD